VEQKLRLNEFKILYKGWRKGILWWDHLLLGLLVWLEDKFIDYRVEITVDEAVKKYHEEMDKVDPVIPPPIYTETLSEGSTSLPEMRLTAPWYKEADKG
jgi:hypothetical protein